MLQTARRLHVRNDRPRLPPVVGDMGLDEVSPFGLQGLKRETLQVLRSDCIDRLAVALALRGTRQQIRDESFVAEPGPVPFQCTVRASFRCSWLKPSRWNSHSGAVLSM